MAMPKKYSWLNDLKRNRRRRRELRKQESRRSLQLERLEQRMLLALGPSLVAVRPNTGGFLDQHDVLNESPREFVLQFSPGQVLDQTTLSSAFQLTRSGSDTVFSAATIAVFGARWRMASATNRSPTLGD